LESMVKIGLDIKIPGDFVGQAGNFSNGVTSIECMYAPEFGFHSEGIRVNVEEVLP